MLLVLVAVTSCEYNDEHFKGLDEMTVPSDLKKVEYSLAEADYAAIAGNSTNKSIAVAIDSATLKELENLKTTRYFSKTLSPTLYLPAFLQTKWPTADDGSSIKVSYSQKDNAPEYLASFPKAVSYTVSAVDYQSVWSVEGIRYFTPSKPFSNSSEMILSAAFPDTESGDVKVVAYNYSNQEPSGFVDPVATSIDEKFDNVVANEKVDISGWVNFAETGGLLWQGKTYSGNSYAQFSAFSAAGPAVSWLISPKVNLADASSPKLAFSVNIGNYNADCLQVLISEDFDGADPTTSTWVDMTSSFGFYNKGKSYTNFYLAGEANLDMYKSNPIHIAFKYSGDKLSDKTTTYQIDNVQIGDNAVVDKTDIYTNDFSAGIDDWKNISVQGTKLWKKSEYNGNHRVEYSAYGTTGLQESWLVSPSVNIPALGTIQLSLVGAVGHYNDDCLSVMISSDFTNDVNTATWIDVTVSFSFPKQTSGYSPVASFGAASLNPFAGKDVVVAFKYEGSVESSATTTYQIFDIMVEEISIPAPKGVGSLKSSMLTQVKHEIYSYTGSNWKKYEDAVILNESDYQSMGFNYFSSSNLPENYLPIYLANRFPYAMEEDFKAVLYFNGNSSTLAADEYVYESGVWVENSGLEVKVDQFVKSNGAWVWDPSTVINLPPVRNDEFIMSYYQAATDWVWENIDQAELGISKKGDGYVSSFGNNDYYTGCSAYYNNVDMRVGKAREQYASGYEGLSDEEALALMKEQLALVMGEVLSIKHPDAKVIEGVEVTYTINLGIFESASISEVTHSLVYKVVGDGEFEWVTGPTPIEK